MKTTQIFAAAALAAMIAMPAFAQTTDDSASAPAPAASTKKAVRAQDRQVEKTIRHALTKTKGLDSSGIVVVVRKTTVTLDGSVPDASQIPMAATAAQGHLGGRTLANNVTVKEPGN